MASPLFAAGFEDRETATSTQTPDERHWQVTATAPTYSTSVLRGAHVVSLRNNTAGAQVLTHAIAAGNRTIAGRVYFRAAAFPAAGEQPHIVNFLNANGNGVIRVAGTGTKVQIVCGASAAVDVGTLTTGQWYRLDFLFDTSGATASMKCRIDGGTEATATNAQTAADITSFRIGTFQSTTGVHDFYFSDLDLDADSSVYPIGPGFVYRFKPTRDGTHSFTAGDFGYDTAGGDVATNATDVYTYLDDDDLMTTTELIRQKVIRTTGYVEVGFGTAPLTHAPVAVSVIYSFHAAGTGADTFGVKANDGGTIAALTNAAGTGLTDVSQTTIMVLDKFLAAPPSGGAWTKAKLEALLIRGGYSDDVNAIPYWDGLMLEVVYRGVIVAGAAPTALAITTYAPTVTATNNQRVTAGLLALTTTRYASTVSTPRLVTPPTKALTITTYAPTVAVSNNIRAVPGTTSLAITAYAPAVRTPRTVTPGVASLAITAYAPTVRAPRTVTPDTAILAITGYAPMVQAPRTVTPGVASLALTAYAPDIAISNHQRVVPDPLGLAVTTYAPTVTASNHQRVTPDPAMLALTAYPPTVAVTAAEAFVPGALALAITGHPPRVKIEPVFDGGFVAETLRLEMLKREREAKRPQRVVPGPLRLEITTYPPTAIVIDDGDVQDILTLTPFDVLG